MITYVVLRHGPELFGALGSFATSRVVHKELDQSSVTIAMSGSSREMVDVSLVSRVSSSGTSVLTWTRDRPRALPGHGDRRGRARARRRPRRLLPGRGPPAPRPGIDDAGGAAHLGGPGAGVPARPRADAARALGRNVNGRDLALAPLAGLAVAGLAVRRGSPSRVTTPAQRTRYDALAASYEADGWRHGITAWAKDHDLIRLGSGESRARRGRGHTSNTGRRKDYRFRETMIRRPNRRTR